jgi:arsenite methyltransferase
VYQVEDARAFLTQSGLDVERLAPQIEGRFASAFIRARKPGAAPAEACCGSDCCCE